MGAADSNYFTHYSLLSTLLNNNEEPRKCAAPHYYYINYRLDDG